MELSLIIITINPNCGTAKSAFNRIENAKNVIRHHFGIKHTVIDEEYNATVVGVRGATVTNEDIANLQEQLDNEFNLITIVSNEVDCDKATEDAEGGVMILNFNKVNIDF